ncbi:endophilin-A3-like [Sinocyclocheilus grahami]|uniref:endophilin-A3-like n=1 Tax=Sinocyclocheilus grahami TaxID=75366 RepID=UPI0007AD028B|nr:PREDICTED: endophilin-A3-like [Sinocyclocheilus grahami]
MEMERKIEVTNKSVFELITKTTEYLQPNPASRAKLGMLNTVSKIRGQVKTTGYPQTEGLLGDCMLRYGRELGEESTFGNVRTYRQSSARMHRHEPQADGYGNPTAARRNAGRSRELYLSLSHTILHTVHCETCFLQYCCTYSI